MSDNDINTGTLTNGIAFCLLEKVKSTIQTICSEIDFFLELKHKMLCRHADKDEILVISTMIYCKDNNEPLLLMTQVQF